MNLTGVTREVEWKNIAEESYRTYLFPAQDEFFTKLVEVRIDNPVLLSVDYNDGGHRIIDTNGKSYYIPAGWVCLFWESHEKGVPTYQF